MSEQTLYARLGVYDAIAAVCSELLPRLQGDALLGRFWETVVTMVSPAKSNY